MALAAKSEALKHVPWFSLPEWHKVYSQIYSNGILEQTKAYETLLVWKARIPKLPVGVECTLLMIQVCLRDRAWTPKIDNGELPMYYENDLRLMYSTTIMKFLNQISNIGHTKQTSLFQIAKQLKIPEWIVSLRHDAAHGHELPAIGSLRMAANVLLAWLHEEYWAVEAKAVEERYEKSIDGTDADESCETRAFVTLVELWIAVGLYIKADYESVSDLPDPELRKTLLNFCTVLDSPDDKKISIDGSGNFMNDMNYRLIDTQSVIFSKIAALIGKNKSIPNIEETIINTLLESETFLAGPDIIGIFMTKDTSIASWNKNSLPIGLTNFWQNFIGLLHEKKMLDELVWRLIDIVNSFYEDSNKRLMASLWIKSICQALAKLRISLNLAQTLEQSLDGKEKRIATKQLMQSVRDRVNKTYPELTKFMWLNVISDVPAFLKDINFATYFMINANDLTNKCVHPILDLVTPKLNSRQKDQLIGLLRIYTKNDNSVNNNFIGDGNRCFTVDDLTTICNVDGNKNRRNEIHAVEEFRKTFVPKLADETFRNDKWDIASGDYDWAAYAFGVLPWQTNSLESLEPIPAVQPKPTMTEATTSIVPGLVDNTNLTMKSRVNWDHVLRTKKRLKRKSQPGEFDVMVDRAIEIVKKRQK